MVGFKWNSYLLLVDLGQTEADRKLEEAEVIPTLPPLVDTSTHYTSLPSQFGEGVGYPLSTQPSSLPPITQPSSLPSDLLATSSFSTPPASTTFHSLTTSTGLHSYITVVYYSTLQYTTAHYICIWDSEGVQGIYLSLLDPHPQLAVVET